jgi:hypothetical protein
MWKQNLALLVFVLIVLSSLGELAARWYASYAFSGAQMPGGINSSSPHCSLGFELRADLDTIFVDKRFLTNSIGCRDREYPVAKGSHFRIVGIGDSVMMGWGVAQGEDYLAVLEERLAQQCPNRDPIDVINFAVNGYNTVQEYYVLRDKALRFDPDLIIVGYVGNDQDPVGYKQAPTRVATPSLAVNFVAMRLLYLAGRIPDGVVYDWRFGPCQDERPLDFMQALQAIYAIGHKWNNSTILLLDSRYESWGIKNHQLVAHAERNGVNAIDLYARYRDLPPNTSLSKALSIRDDHNVNYLIEIGVRDVYATTPQVDNHANARWHARTAEVLLQEIVDKQLVPGCRSPGRGGGATGVDQAGGAAVIETEIQQNER